MNDTLVLIAAYKPTDTLTELANSLYTVGFRIVVVDDGSGDEYSAVFDKTEAYATVIGYEKNRGKGYALRYGIDFIIKEKPYFKYLITVDADGQHTESAVLAVSNEIHRTGGMVIGQRIPEKSRMSSASRFSNFCVRSLLAFSTGIYIHDALSGLRAFEFSYLPSVTKVAGDGFDYETNVLTDAVKRRIPIRTVKTDKQELTTRNVTVSHYRLMRDLPRQIHGVFARCFPSAIAVVAFFAIILIAMMIVGTTTAGVTASVMLGGYFATALSVILNNRIGYEKNGDGLLSYNRILMGSLRMFVYIALMIVFHNIIGLTPILALILSALCASFAEMRIMRKGLDKKLRYRP